MKNINNTESISHKCKFPGTVSKILWHFPGGPRWNATNKKQDKLIKPPDESFDILCKIIESKTLRLGNYKEIIKINAVEKTEYQRTGGNAGPKEITAPLKIEKIIKNNVIKEIESVNVCCLSDIPLQHLQYHANRYGKFAIGFHRNSIINNDFNPVLYTLEDKQITQLTQECFQSVKYSTDYNEDIKYHINNVIQELESIGQEIIKSYLYLYLEPIKELLNVQKLNLDMSYQSMKNIITFMKTITEEELYSIFCEREWRSSKEFKFNHNDIAMIILPRDNKKKNYYNEFINSIQLPREIPIIPWEDIIEH